MPFVPDPRTRKRLAEAVDRAALGDAERVFFLLAFLGWLLLDGVVLARGATWVGALGVVGGFAILYWRLRGGHLTSLDRELHGLGLRTEAQRAFTALMLRQAVTGRNALRRRPEHDPYAAWAERRERTEAVEEA